MTQEQIDPIQNAIDALELAQQFIPASSYKESRDKCSAAIAGLKDVRARYAGGESPVGTAMESANPDATIATFNADRVPVGAKLYARPVGYAGGGEAVAWTTPEELRDVMDEDGVGFMWPDKEAAQGNDIAATETETIALYTHSAPAVPDDMVHILSIKNGNIWHTEQSDEIKLPPHYELKLYATKAMLTTPKETNQ